VRKISTQKLKSRKRLIKDARAYITMYRYPSVVQKTLSCITVKHSVYS